MSDRKIASEVVVVRHADFFSLQIDGEEFPYFISSDPIETQIEDAILPSVRFTLLAERVRFDNSLEVATEAAV